MALASNYIAWEVGRYGGILLILAYVKARNLPFLHRHDGYVSMNGAVWNCSRCGKAPRDLESQLAEVRAEMAAHPWMLPYMGPDRAEYPQLTVIRRRLIGPHGRPADPRD